MRKCEQGISFSYGEEVRNNDFCDPITRFPAASYPGSIDLRIVVSGEEIYGSTVRVFFVSVLKFIIQKNALSKISIPFKTTGSNYLIAEQPIHPSGRPFASFEKMCTPRQTLYININHPRFFALRQGFNLLQAAGFCPSLSQSFD
jgi:hypothetical protein